MKSPWFALSMLTAAAFLPHGFASAGPASEAVVATDFSNPGLSPSNWTLTLHRDGSGHFHSARGDSSASKPLEMEAPNVDRDVQVSAEFAERVFRVAGGHRWFNEQCESHMKVAFQGWKKLSYVGPEGNGSCTFNFSRDKEIQALGDELVSVAETLQEGARLEMLLQHDPLGLDREMEFLMEASKDGRMRQICTIREILERLQDDPAVLERVRKRARVLLANAGT